MFFGKDVYPEYFARADVIGFDYYTFGKACTKPYEGLGYTFDEHRELMKLTSKPTFQWIETGPLEGYCLGPDRPQLTPERLAAQVWLAIAAGATGLGYFTHTWYRGSWERFDVRAGARRYGGSLYVIAVNATEQPVTATLTRKGLVAGSRLDVWQEGRTVKVKRRGAITDRFGPLQVHIYRTR